jgi:hypothetical protein
VTAHAPVLRPKVSFPIVASDRSGPPTGPPGGPDGGHRDDIVKGKHEQDVNDLSTVG